MRTKTPKLTTAFEAVCAPIGRVDKAARIIYGVKVLGPKSQWGRVYTEEAINRDYTAYEGAKVYMGEVGGVKVAPSRNGFGGGVVLSLKHQAFARGRKPRTPLAGTLRKVRPTRNGVYANLHCEPGATGDLVMEAASQCPETFGLSHVASIKSDVVPSLGGGRTEVVWGFGPIHYVEIVSNPATNKNIFEGLEMNDDTAVAAPVAMGVEEAFTALEMAIVHEYEGADRIAALKVVDKFKSQLLGGDEGGEEGGDDGAGAAQASASREGVAEANATPITAVRRVPSLRSEIAETNSLLRQMIEAQAQPQGRRFSPARSASRRPVALEAVDEQQPQKPKPEKIPYGDRAAMRRFLES